MRLAILFITICNLLLVNISFAQNNYWTESFESANIPGNAAGAFATPTAVTLPSGVWTMNYLYRGSTGVCDGKPLRLLNTTTVGVGLDNPSYAITPSFSTGVGQLFFVENSGQPRTISIYSSTDNGVTFSLYQQVATVGKPCDTTILTINNAAINKLKFVNETTLNIGLDNMKVSKNGTLLDGTNGGGGTGDLPADTTRYYADEPNRLPAFPGAEGAGKYTRGGRGGVVVEVTNLEDDINGNIVGSFRWAQRQNTGPKTIVFRVSGTIHLVDALSFARGDVTIAGQTAPGGGICIADFPVTVGKKNIIMRHMRFRLGDIGIARTKYSSSSGDAVGSSGGANADSIIVDHCTASWSIDEVASFKNMTHFTMQNCLISEPLNNSAHAGELHGYGGIWGGVNASFHHNLFAHCSSRNCRFNGSRQYSAGEKDTVDYRNNVIYNWGINTVNGGEGGFYNIVNNYYKPGPSTNLNVISRTLNPYKLAPLPYGKFYMTGNVITSSPEVTANNWLGVKMEDGLTALGDTGLSKVAYPIKTYFVNTHTAEQAYEVVLNNAGATLPVRDIQDQKIINDVINGTGAVIDVQGGFPKGTDSALTKGAWPTLLSIVAPLDSDKDGMADEWELQRGLNPAVATDRNGVSLNGYTHLENYLNGDSIVAQGIENTCMPLPAITAIGSNNWLQLKDASYTRLIATDTNNVVAAIKDEAGYGAIAASYFTTTTNRIYNGKAYLNRNITLIPTNTTAGNVLVRFYFTKAEFDSLQIANTAIKSLSDLRVLKASDNICTNTIAGNITTIVPSAFAVYGTYANGYYVEFTTNGLGTFFLGTATSNAPLPLSLLSFKAVNNKNNVKLSWTTTNEVNTKQFLIERSTDGKNFTTIGNVKAIDKSGLQSYQFADNGAPAGIIYYRLTMMDKDDRFTFSNIVAIQINNNDALTITPNPAHSYIIVSHPKALPGARITTVSAVGRLISDVNVNANAVQSNFSVEGLVPGMYMLVFNNNGKKLVKQFIKK